MESNLFQAIRLKDISTYKNLIGKVDINLIDEDGQNLLHEAISHDNTDVAIDLIDRGINLNTTDINGQTPLHFSAQYNNLKVASEIIRKGGDINIKDIHGNNPLWTAVFNARGKYEFVRLLMKHGANTTTKNKAGRSALDFASQIKDDTLIAILANI